MTAPSPDARPDLHGMLPDDLIAHTAAAGHALTPSEARRVLAHTLSAGNPDLSGMRRPISKVARAAVASATRWSRPRIIERVTDPGDASVRYLFQAEDGAVFEAVRIPLHKADAFSVCLSSQVGCAMRCAFCATGRLSLTRNLLPHEMFGAFCAVRDEAPGRVTGAVFMGQGEPFHNYDHVLQTAQILSHPCGGRVSNKGITISTVGLVPQIERFTAERHKFRLVVSMTSALADRRQSLLPVAAKWSLEALADALRGYHHATRRRVTIAWVLLGGVNTGRDEVDALQTLLQGVPLRINLIDVNDARPDGFGRATDPERDAFFDALQVLRAPIVRRYSVGASQASACGMLAAGRENSLRM